MKAILYNGLVALVQDGLVRTIMSDVPRMTDMPRSGVCRFGPFSVNAVGRALRRNGADVPIGSRAFDLLVALVQRQGEVLSNRDLMSFAWSGLSVEESNVRVQMAHLRRDLGCGVNGARYVMSVAGRGYCFVAPVEWTDEESESNQALPEGYIPRPLRSITARVSPLPASAEKLYGREESLADLKKAVIERQFVTIVGPGGVGKTAVAIDAARTNESFEKTYFLDLTSLSDQGEIVEALALQTGLQTIESEAFIRALVERQAKQRTLIVLDNCEHVIAEVADFIARVMNYSENIHFLATSREALRLRGEAVYLLRPLSVPPNTGRLTAKRALAWPGVQLFMERALSGGYDEALSDEASVVVAGICRRLDGNPLAIELAASRVATYGLDRVAALIDSRVALRWRGNRNASPRHQSVTAMLDWSYDLLSEDSKRVFRQLSVFGGEFSHEAAEQIAFLDERSPNAISDAIADLIDKSLLSASSASGQTQLRLLDLAKAYAAIKLSESGEGQSIRRRHALYHRDALKKMLKRDREMSCAANDTGTACDVKNLLSALEWVFSPEGETSLAVELCSLAGPVFCKMSHLHECSRWSKKALSLLAEHPADTTAELTLLESFAISSFYTSSDVIETESAFKKGVELSVKLNDRRRWFHFMAGLHALLLRSGDFRQMMEVAKCYAIEARFTGDSKERAISEWMLGNSYHILGDQRKAHKAYLAGFEMTKQVARYPWGHFETAQRTYAKASQARVYWLTGSFDLSLQLVEEAIVEHRYDTMSRLLCMIVGVDIFVLCGQYMRARAIIDEVQRLTAGNSLGGLRDVGITIGHQISMLLGDHNDAVRALKLHVDTVRSGNLALATLTTLSSLAQALGGSKQHEEALSAIDAAIGYDERVGGTFKSPELLRIKACLLMEKPEPRFELAHVCLTRALEAAREQHSIGWELRIKTDIAKLRVLEGEGKGGHAFVSLQEFLMRFNNSVDTEDLRSANSLLNDNYQSLPSSTEQCICNYDA